MGSFLVLVEGMTVITNPSAFVKAEGGDITEAALQRLPSGHYLELKAPPAQDPEGEPRHRAVIRLDRPSLPRGGWPITPRSDSLGGRIAAATARENEKESTAEAQTSTDVDESKVGW